MSAIRLPANYAKCAAFRPAPLRISQLGRQLRSCRTLVSKCPIEENSGCPSTPAEPHHASGIVESAAVALIASGMLAGSSIAAEFPESAVFAVQAAKLASDVLRPLFNIFTILYIIRVPMTWYPDIDGNKLPWLVAYVPTEPILSVTRKVVPLVSGVDVSPIVWVGLISFLNEILLGPQGLLTLIQARGGL